MPSLAITDHGVMYGIIDFYKAAKARGVKPILGCEAYITTGNHKDRGPEAGQSRTHHLVLLAEDDVGYANLVKLISIAHLDGFYYKPRIDKELLATYSRGLIGLTACLKGEVTTALANDHLDTAVRIAGEYSDILGPDNFFIEVQDHGLPEQRKANRLMAQLSRKTGVPLVATNDVHYLEKAHAAAHEVLLCLQTQTVLSDPKRMRYQTDEFYLKSREEMERIFQDFPGAVDQPLAIAERCNVEIEFNRLHFPTFPAPDGSSQKAYLMHLVVEGIRQRYQIPDPLHPRNADEREICERFMSELGVIEKTGFINYFLVVWDFVHFAHERGIPVGPGRGSGGGSVVAYALGITAIDPLRYDLIFERFLNPERVSPPDFDIDFCQARRGEVIDYVKQKYGSENVAQIITFGSLGAKTVIRDVGRVLEIDYGRCDKFSKMVPDDPKITLTKALEASPDLRVTYETDEACKRILDYGFVLEGLYRHPGTHAAGVVIGEKPLIEILPLSLDKDKQPLTQFSMEPLGDLGLLKMDFLGLKTLTVIQETIDLVREHRNVTIDIDNLPLDDEPTYALLNRGDTIGVFQLESSGMRDLIRRIGIGTIEDLTAMIALYRPGPMNMLDDYVNRKTGKSRTAYAHPLLEPILKETHGVMVYQEQVQKAANVLAGYSLGDADVLRRAMGKKKREVMEKQRVRFIDGCLKTHRIPAREAGRIFDTMAEFAGYGFNKAHSTGYAIIGYQTAYLKANYPAEFMSALISSEIGNFDKIPVFVCEAGAMGLKILPPDVNCSAPRFRPEGQGIRYGLAGVKNVGHGAAEAVAAERKSHGEFSGLIDFCCRVDSQMGNKKVIESLVRCGAFDGVDPDRARLFGGIDFAMTRAATTLSDRLSGQGNLFSLMEEPMEQQAEELPPSDPWTESQLLAGEKELLGLYMSGHPLSQYAGLLATYAMTTLDKLATVEDRAQTRVGGIISSIRKTFSKQTKEPIAFLQLDDLEGSSEVRVWAEAYRDYGALLQPEAPVMVCGTVRKRDDSLGLEAHEIYPLADAPRHFCKRISIHLPATSTDKDRLLRMKEILSLHPGNVPVVICLQYPSGKKVFVGTESRYRVNPDQDLIRALERDLGERSVFVSVNPSPCKKPREPRNRWARNGNA